MPRPSRTHKMPPPRHPIQRVRCSCCGRSWAAYEGRIPRGWTTALDNAVFCDRRPCNEALAQGRGPTGP